MSGEKFEDARNSGYKTESPAGSKEKPFNLIDPDQSGVPGSDRNQGRLKEFDPMNTTLAQWTVANHLEAIVRKANEQHLPLPSSKTAICWDELIVRGAGAEVTHQQTVGQILQGPLNAKKAISRRGRHTQRTILHKVEGIVKAAEMLLVLGRPGSGCTTLLKTLCGVTDEDLQRGGTVRYNGVDLETFRKHFRGDAIFTSDGKIHFERQTPAKFVQSTLTFLIFVLGLPWTSHQKQRRPNSGWTARPGKTLLEVVQNFGQQVSDCGTRWGLKLGMTTYEALAVANGDVYL
jgi:ATPase subunit of ABC transporter with duplicated ATPase domains